MALFSLTQEPWFGSFTSNKFKSANLGALQSDGGRYVHLEVMVPTEPKTEKMNGFLKAGSASSMPRTFFSWSDGNMARRHDLKCSRSLLDDSVYIALLRELPSKYQHSYRLQLVKAQPIFYE
jgi:hypothetical protein